MPANNNIDESQVRAFLLGRLSPPEAAEIELRIGGDSDFRELLESVREELFDDYARGRLSGSDASSFRRHNLNTPEGRAKLEFATAFAGHSAGRPRSKRNVIVQVSAALLLSVVSFYAGRLWYRPAISIDLRPGAVRATQAPRVLEVPARASLVEFRLYPDQIAGDRAVIFTLDEKEVASGRSLPLPDGGRRFAVPVEILSSGTYVIQLSDRSETIATFVVHIRKI